MRTTPPPLPINELFEICTRATDDKVWAISDDTSQWIVYTSSKKSLGRIPKTYRGMQVVGFVYPRPRILKNG